MIRRAMSLAIMVWVLGFALFAVLLPRPADGETTDAIVVMTGSPGRIERGFALLSQKKGKRLLISGVDRRVKPHELAAEFHVPKSLIDCCVDLGHESVDTRSNAAEAALWVKQHRYRSVRLVTVDWHMPRARRDLAAALDDDVTLVADAVRSEPTLIRLVREYNKYLLRHVAAFLGI